MRGISPQSVARFFVADATDHDLQGDTAFQEAIDRFQLALNQLKDTVGWRGLAHGHPSTAVENTIRFSNTIITSYPIVLQPIVSS